MKNRLLENKRNHVTTFGTFTQLKSTIAIENIAVTPFEFIAIDAEHQEISADYMASAVAAVDGAGKLPLVRICDITRKDVLYPLDAGAAGIIVPAVRTVEEVKRLVEYAKFEPIGRRGYLPTRDVRWGTEAGFTPVGYMEEANRETMLIPQCETAECLEHIEEIAAIDGVDGIFVGPMDLSISLGCPLQLDAEPVKKAIVRVLEACKANGKLSMIFAGSAENAKELAAMGYDSVAVGADIFLLISAYQDLSRQVFGE